MTPHMHAIAFHLRRKLNVRRWRVFRDHGLVIAFDVPARPGSPRGYAIVHLLSRSTVFVSWTRGEKGGRFMSPPINRARKRAEVLLRAVDSAFGKACA